MYANEHKVKVYLLLTADILKPHTLNGIQITLVDRVLLNTFQNLKVSSPAPVTMASPSGDIA